MNEIISFKSLYQAYTSCRQRKRRTANTQRYEMQLLDNLYNTLAALQTRSYSPSPSICFVAQKPKAREIHAADFRDRVVHHWLVPKLERLYEPIFIHDVYSNRSNKGTHKAIDRLQGFMQGVGHQGWYLQLDIVSFFNRIDRAILFKLIQQRLRKAVKNDFPRDEADILRWLSHILLKHDATKNSRYCGNPQLMHQVPLHKQLAHAGKNKGLPIGNLTSQFFANIYMNLFDQFVKHTLKCRYYLRYVDDFILLADNPETLLNWRQQIITFLDYELALELKKEQGKLPQPRAVKAGADFLGYIVYPHYRLVRRRVVGSLREKLEVFQQQIIKGDLHLGYILIIKLAVMETLRAVLASYWGHFKHANSYKLRQQLIKDFAWLTLLFYFTEDDLCPQITTHSHAPTWECNLQRSSVAARDAGASGLHSHAGAWERENTGAWERGNNKFIPRYKPNKTQIIGYKSQIHFFRSQFPCAALHIQRGTEIDIVKPDDTYLPNPYALQDSVIRIDSREDGYLKNGLKSRIIFRLLIQPGIQL